MAAQSESLGHESSNENYLAREKLCHIVKSARSATAANILAPLLCIPVFGPEVNDRNFKIWLGYMFFAVLVRTLIIHKIDCTPEKIDNPQRDLRIVVVAVGLTGLGWGLGWPLMATDLSLINRMIYIYMTTAAMIASMFAYSVDRRVFYTFTFPIMVPAISTILWPTNIFPWPFTVGLGLLYLIVLGISRNFSKIFTESINLRFKNETLYEELAKERDESISANIAKSKFISVASHDLRQPLHAVNINLDLFRFSDLVERDATIVRRIKNSVTALNHMFEALLNLNRLDSSDSRVNSTNFLLEELSEEVRQIAEPQAIAKGLFLHIHVPSLVVSGDKFLLQQLLLNLVANAIQYTRAGGVKVRFEDANHRLLIRVSDTGVGISSEDQKRIFDEFYRSENTRSAHEGLGLGLSIVKRLCKIMKASVSVKSELGSGSEFLVSTNCPVINSGESFSPNDVKAHLDDADNNGLHGKVIAVVEDDAVITDAYKLTLMNRGADVVVFSEYDDLSSAVENIDRIDCILSDYHLRGQSGVDVIRKIREIFNLEIPAVIVTGDTSPKIIKSLSEFNALVLHKPVTLNKISEAIVQAIKMPLS